MHSNMELYYRLILLLVLLFKQSNAITPYQPSCHAEEGTALLQFKQSFLIDASASGRRGAYPKVKSWKQPREGENNSSCCSWDGVECDEKTGHVIGLDLHSSCLYGSINSSSSLFRLVHLQRLNLADNHFNYSQIPNTIRNFPSLTHLNLSESVFSGQVPFEISQLSKLSSLRLSLNVDPSSGEGLLRLDESKFRRLVQNLTRLEHLSLRSINISSTIPDSMANLSLLTYLDLHQCELFGDFPVRIFKFQNLKSLYLRDNRNLIGYLPEFNQTSTLMTLDLHGTRFFGDFSSSIKKLGSLKQLDLCESNFSGGLFPSSLGSLRELSYLDLSFIQYGGPIPDSYANLTELTTFRITFTRLTGPIPSWIGNFSKLVYLDFAYNRLNGSIPESFSNLTNLENLYLPGNRLSGRVNFQIFLNMPNLSEFFLSYNNLELVFESTNANASSVQQFTLLNLNSCNMREFPYILRYQKRLERLELSDNKLYGQVPKWIYNMSTETLKYLDLSSNFLSGFEPLPVVLPWANLQLFSLSNNNFHGRLPVPASTIDYLVQGNNFSEEVSPLFCNMSSLQKLDLSDNNLSGMIPQCFNNLSSLQVFEPLPVVLPWAYQQLFSLSNNNFHGRLPVPASTIAYLVQGNNFSEEVSPLFCNMSSLQKLDLSDNNLSGMIPQCFNNLSSLQVFDLSDNNLSGMIPQCFNNLSSLQVFDLSNNNFSGMIPQFFGSFSESLIYLLLGNNSFHGLLPETYSNKSSLKVIDVSYNQLQGKLPRTLVNCMMLETLILSNNYFSDVFPFWLRSLPELKLLEMRHNRFSGMIREPGNNQRFPKLRVLDMSFNNFTGEFLAQEIFSEYAMRSNITIDQSLYIYIEIDYKPGNRNYVGTNESIFGSTLAIASKGVDRYYSKIQKALAIIDISSNNFEGKIDDWIGNLKGLWSLNASNNLLTGEIPSSLGNLTKLESLDLSNNKLSGMIPEQLAQLTFLSLLDVSHNDLTGRIPQGPQLSGFNVTFYEGNPGLCGDPLPKKCGNSDPPAQSPPSSEEESDSGSGLKLVWIFVLAGFGSGLVVGVVLADMAIIQKRELFLEIVGKLMRCICC